MHKAPRPSSKKTLKENSRERKKKTRRRVLTSCIERRIKNLNLKVVQFHKKVRCNVESRLTANSPQRPFFLADSPYIDSCFNLSTMDTFFCPQGSRCREIQLSVQSSFAH